MNFWLMVNDDRGDWRFIRAEAPCWKGELRMSFRWFRVVIGWQRKPVAVLDTAEKASAQ
jgi:hypothetical protein